MQVLGRLDRISSLEDRLAVSDETKQLGSQGRRGLPWGKLPEGGYAQVEPGRARERWEKGSIRKVHEGIWGWE